MKTMSGDEFLIKRIVRIIKPRKKCIYVCECAWYMCNYDAKSRNRVILLRNSNKIINRCHGNGWLLW